MMLSVLCVMVILVLVERLSNAFRWFKRGLKIQRLNPADENPNPDTPIRTVGSYLPYASTLYWYIQDSMPFLIQKFNK